jgi:hypothetical protein
MRLVIVLAILVSAVGCSMFETKQPAPIVQPVIEQPTYQGVTQYDYKAGAPDEYTAQPDTPESTPNPYLTPTVYEPIPTASGGSSSTGWAGGSYYYTPVVKILIWQGTGTLTKN